MTKRLLTILFALSALTALAQQTNIRYVCNNNSAVSYKANDGTTAITGYHVPGRYENDGTSWATAKDNIQDAINDLVNNNLSGEVWVASGTYYPTETTESTGGSTLYMSFKIPKGITVRGGFRGMVIKNEYGSADNKSLGADSVAYAGESKTSDRYKITNSTSSVGYYYPYQMILDGSISANHKTPKFTWNSTKHQYDTEFYGNSYHVVTFALNGFDSDGHAKPLGTTAEIVAANGELAKLEGAMIKNGNAYNSSTDGHPHNAYGGGVYMVPGASLEDVAVENCEASRDGGGVYMDGGGRCCHVYVADCQALGSSLSSGYGGGICVDENLQVFPPMVLRSATINCVARYGGGLANRVNHPTVKITAGSKTYDMRYNQGFSANVISGCTAISEGGGVYALNGGSFTQMTIARNACYGSGITVNSMKTGQSAGFYARNNVVLANSILWGGAINNNTATSAQFASSRSTTSDKAEIYYVAMNNLGRVDFTGVKSIGTKKLSNYNNSSALLAANASSNTEEGYVNFLNPLGTAGYTENAAINHFKAYESGSATNNGISYKVQYASVCTNAGVPTGDLDTEKKTPDQKGKTADVFGDLFSSNPTLGAYTSYEPAMAPDVEYTTETTTYATSGKTYTQAIAHVFVDPETTSDATENVGSAWDKPIKHLADALNTIGEVASARLPQIEKYNYTITKIVVHVKEGTTTVQGAGATGSIRETSLNIPDITVTRADGSKFIIPLEILGGYNEDITDDFTNYPNGATGQSSANFPARHGYADATVRNPILYPTVVTGYVMDDYAYTTPHLFKIENIKAAVTIDGLQVRYANAWSTTLDNTVTTGGAFTINNSTDVTLKNVLIADCQASNGPAIYETGSSNVSLENCIIHNNTVNVTGITNGNFEKGGIVYVESGSTMTLNHCDVLRNVGYAFYNDGTVTMDNSICYANMSTALDDTNGNDGKAMKTFAGSGTVSSLYNSGDTKYNLFDTGSESDSKATAIGTANQTFTFVSGTDNHYPAFMNPTKNSGVSEDGDATYYGRSTSFEPQNTNNGVNAASTGGVAHASSTSDNSWGTDMTTNINRDYGGLPDIGAVESHTSTNDEMGDAANSDGQPAYGTLYYVRYYDGDLSTGGDGMSWENAINGNSLYDEETGQFLGNGEIETGEYKTVTETTYSAGSTTTTPSANSTKYKIRIAGSENYLKLDGTTVSTTTTFEDADVFYFNTGYKIYDASNSYYYYLSGSGSSRSLAYNTSSQNTNWKLSTSGTYVTIYYKSNNSGTFYWYINGSTLEVTTTQNSASSFEIVAVAEKTTPRTVPVTEKVDGMNGLQYAVNKASHAYSSDNVRREVWVAAGTYAKDPETKAGANFGIDASTSGTDESCFIIRDGVDVYGAFPKAGNPCKNERQALLSTFIKKRSDKSQYTTSDYETILQPATAFVSGSGSSSCSKTCRVLGQPYACNPENSSYTTYKGAKWDGFTLYGGYIDSKVINKSAGNGGAGAIIYTNVTLKNCVVTNNINFAPTGITSAGTEGNYSSTDVMRSGDGYRGGGMVVRGGTVEECYIINNKMIDTQSTTNTTVATSSAYGVAYGGGIYFKGGGTIYNSVIANNLINAGISAPDVTYGGAADGAGMFIDGDVNCYNNTIVNNKATLGTNSRGCGGVALYNSGGSSKVQIFNTIIANNDNYKAKFPSITFGNENIAVQNGGEIVLTNCVTESTTGGSQTLSNVAYSITYTNSVAKTGTDLTSVFSNLGSYSDTDNAFASLDLRLASGSAAINAGLDSPTLADGTTVDLSTYTDMDYEDRIQDCTIDIGAYEYNGAYDIAPDTESESGKAIYYVTPKGYGTASANSPANAACADKLQKVIDAAGRYKYLNPTTTVIVKVANSYSMEVAYEADQAKAEAEQEGLKRFTYYACRTTDDEGKDQDTRIWSIIVPQGVEVWGGYTDVDSDHTTTSWSNTNNGFYSGSGDTYTDLRDVINNPTYFDASYYNSDENTQVYAYHVVSFTNKVYDGNGDPYKTGDNLTGNSTYTSGDTYMKMTDASSSIGRGVVDGIFITGGMADAVTTTKTNYNIYGGAAIVNDYGHVRNCIVRGNYGNYGGGLALAKGGLISGCLIDQNTGWYNGGGVYVLTDEENTNIGVTSTEIPHIYTSTIVNNSADVQGGGLCFNDKDNVRVNSSVIWQNHCSDMANVAGTYSPEKAETDPTAAEEYYPISYTAIQNLRVSGENNISVDNDNKKGTRFWKDGDSEETTLATDENNFSDFGYYLPTTLSGLLRVGMPVENYNTLVTSDGLATADFSGLSRTVVTSPDVRSYIDMGARAKLKKISDDVLMLRLYVAKSEDFDADAIIALQNLDEPSSATDAEKENIKYYKQEGSSFAYPFQSLQEAIDYIYTKRGCIMEPGGIGANTPVDNANLLPFEIMMAKGTYYPTEDLMGNAGKSFSNTFAIPEGVSIYGGFAVNQLDSKNFYGRYYKAKSTLEATYATEATATTENPNYITKNIEGIHTDESADVTLTGLDGYTFVEASTKQMTSDRPRTDVNGNSIIEPWEFQNQTYLSGKSVGDDANGVFHVITYVPDENVVGVLPPKAVDFSSTYDKATENDKKYMNHEHGQYSVLNGLIITGGSAMDFLQDVDMDELAKYNYYHGGGLLADGNRYNNSYNTDEAAKYTSVDAYNAAKGTSLSLDEWQELINSQYLHSGVTNAVAYRDQIINISQCKFTDNEAGYGGAMSVNGTVDVYNSTFENNYAEYHVDNNVPKNGSTITVKYPGQGGAVFSTHQFAAYNTVFANNEARSTSYTLDGAKCPSYRNPDESTLNTVHTGIGGAIYSGKKGHFHLINCDVVRNMANMFPAVFTSNPNTYTSTEQTSCSINDYNQFLNTVVWGNELNATMKSNFSGNAAYTFNAPLICNYGAKDRSGDYSLSFTSGVTDKASLQTGLDALAETAWFSAYEDGRGITCNNKVDMRDAQFRPYLHATTQIKSNGGVEGENCNIEIDSENSTLEGPNFSSPSTSAGIDGYDEGADWSPARLNNLTDNGSGKIYQHIVKDGNENYTCEFPDYTKAATYDSQYTYGSYDSSRITGTYAYSNETASDYVTSGAYTTTRYMIATNYANTIPLGDDYYMKSLNGTTEQQNLYRISYDPNPTHNATYIDIGVYEYPHTPLKASSEGDEVDIIWVSSEEKPDNGLPEGSAWSQPTSDLQRAIETLLSSRNGHRKEIRLMDGTYSPTYTIEGNLAFYFDTKYINSSVVLPTENGTAKEGLGVKSFTIKGGYSKDLNDQYDVDEYPAIIRQKKQTESGTTFWNHLFYVKDATQRYGYKTGYVASNGYGWWTTTEDQESKPAPTTIPIQIDGVKMVNNQANAGVDGAAIYYQNQTFGSDCVQFDENGEVLESGTTLDGYYTDAECTKEASGTANGSTKYYKKIFYRAIAPTSAYVSLMDENGDKVEDKTHSPAVIYYTDANHTSVSSTETAYTGYYYKSVEKTAPYKFIISRSTIMNSGAVSNAAVNSAAYIGKFGGEALVYNSVFHSNRGDALNAYATKTINNTFALNTGKLVLNDKTGDTDYDDKYSYTSKIYNSVFWKNNSSTSSGTTTYGTQFNLVASDKTYDGTISNGQVSNLTTNIQSNAYTGGNDEAIEYELKSGESTNTIIGNNYNVGLSASNTDAVYGPNFVDPNDSYTGTDDDVIEARDFKLQPSLRLLNRGDNNTAHDTALTNGTALYSTGNLTAATPQFGDIYDLAWVTSTNTDAASEARIVVASNGLIDLGAYEYQSKQNRVLYVDPNKLASGTGLSWSSPFGYGNIQAAIDACAVYYKNNHKQAYVFVKANSGTNLGQHSGEALTMRNGVAVYGSVVSDYLEDCKYGTNAAGDYIYDDTQLADYVNGIKIYHRNGILSPTEGHTRISGINTNGTAFDATETCQNTVDNVTTMVLPMSVIDGFDVTAQTNASSDAMAKVTEPVININPKKSDTDYATGGLKMVIHNIAVHGNDYSEPGSDQTEMNLVNINNALLYEALIYNNKVKSTASVLNVHDYGYAASVTVEGKTTGADNSTTLNNVSGTDNPVSGNTTASHIYNSITNYSNDPSTWKTLSGYCYKQSHQGFNYQLTEVSKYIDAITVDKSNQQAVLGGAATADYKSGGMPANFSSFIHYWPEISGEVWTQADRDVLGNFRLQTLGTVAGGKYDGNDYKDANGNAASYAPKLDRGACETWDIQQSTLNLFPDFAHDGSVEYIRAGKSFVIDPIVKGVVNSAHQPGFVLMELGSNLYGNGRRVEISYIASECSLPKASFASGSSFIMAAPFKMNYTDKQLITSGLASFDKGVAVKGIGLVSYDSDGGLIYKDANSTIKTYNGANRSAYDYEFANADSKCWELASGDVAAAHGVMIVNNGLSDNTDDYITYRVTSKGSTYEDNVYTEEVNYLDNHVYQTVTLTKYDDSESTKEAADFTKAEDQGWNCIGLPYLVSSYKPYNQAGVTTYANPDANKPYVTIKEYGPTDTPSETLHSIAMVNPHVMWLYYNGTTSPDGTNVDGDGGYYSVNSWDNTSWHQASGVTPHLYMGEGFFVQNQKFSGDEELKFYCPVAPTFSSGSDSKSRLSSESSFNTRYYYDATAIEDLDNNQAEDAVLGDISISVRKRNVTVTGLEGGESIRIYDATGRVYNMATATDSEYHTALPTAGIYIIAVDNKTKKVMAK